MISHKKVIDAIFNENSKVVSQGYENAIEVELPGGQKMKIFMLDSQWKSIISVDTKEDGSIISIDASKFETLDDTSSYIRFRIHGKELKKLITCKKFKDNIFKTYSENNEIIDFRLNEKRSMPIGLVNLISSKKEFKIQAVHFLLLMDMKYNLASTGFNYSARALEPNLWREYVNCEIEDFQFVGYHWKEKASLKQPQKCEDDDKYKYVENFNSLIRIEEKKCSIGTIIIYIIAFVVL